MSFGLVFLHNNFETVQSWQTNKKLKLLSVYDRVLSIKGYDHGKFITSDTELIKQAGFGNVYDMQEVVELNAYLSKKCPKGAKKTQEIKRRYVIKTKAFMPCSRTRLRRIFTVAKANSIAIIATKGFHPLQLLISNCFSILEEESSSILISFSLSLFSLFSSSQYHCLNQ